MGLGSYTVGDNLEEYLFVDCSADNYDLSLDSTQSVNIRISLIAVSGGNVCTITDAAAKTINGASSLVLSVLNDSYHLVFSTENDEWRIISSGPSQASIVRLADAGGYYVDTYLEGALQEIADGTALDSRYNALTTTAFIPAHSFIIAQGSPTQEMAPATLGLPCWSCATGNNEGVVALLRRGTQIPTHWNTFNVEVIWCSRGTNTGDVRWQNEFNGFSETDVLAAVTFGSGYVDAGPGIAFEVVNTPTATGVSVPAKELLVVHFRRNGAAGTDTLTDSASFLGLLLTKAS